MALEIRLYPDPVLRERAEPVDEITDEIRRLADEMVETLTLRVGYGLAAPQVGVRKRLIVVDVDEHFYVLANPEIVQASEETELGVEGCLSLPGVEAEVERAKRVVVRGLAMSGEPVTVEAEGLLARVFQHEIDHLDGVLFIDRLGRAKRQRLLKAYERARREREREREREKAPARAL